jgi:hypothetical protein
VLASQVQVAPLRTELGALILTELKGGGAIFTVTEVDTCVLLPPVALTLTRSKKDGVAAVTLLLQVLTVLGEQSAIQEPPALFEYSQPYAYGAALPWAVAVHV